MNKEDDVRDDLRMFTYSMLRAFLIDNRDEFLNKFNDGQGHEIKECIAIGKPFVAEKAYSFFMKSFMALDQALESNQYNAQLAAIVCGYSSFFKLTPETVVELIRDLLFSENGPMRIVPLTDEQIEKNQIESQTMATCAMFATIIHCGIHDGLSKALETIKASELSAATTSHTIN